MEASIVPECPISLGRLKDPVILDCTCHGTVVPNVPLCAILESLGLGDKEDEDTTVTNIGDASPPSPCDAPSRAVASEDTQEQQTDQPSCKDTKKTRPLQLADPIAVEPPAAQKLRLAAPQEEEEEIATVGGGDYTKKGRHPPLKKQLQLAAVEPPQDTFPMKPASPMSPSLLVAKGGPRTAPLIRTKETRTENGGNKEIGRREMYDEENIDSNHHVKNGRKETTPFEERSDEPPSASKPWIRIGIAAFFLLAIIGGIITAVMIASESDPTTTSAVAAPVTAPTPTALTSDPTPAPISNSVSALTPTPVPAPIPTLLVSASTPTASTPVPVPAPSAAPTPAPSIAPSTAPTSVPVPAPSAAPSMAPVPAPSAAPTPAPSIAPTRAPIPTPTLAPVPPTTPAPVPVRVTTPPTPAPVATPTPAPIPAPTMLPRPCDAKQLGSDLDGEAADDKFGGSVSLSSDGNRLAVGSTYNDGNGSDAGHVRVFDWSGSTWIQMGSDLDGGTSFDGFGRSVSLSPDGNRLAVAATPNDGNGSSYNGHVLVFDWSGSTWIQAGSDLKGEAVGDYFGSSLSLSSDGDRLAVGTISNSGNGLDSGHVRVFELKDASCEA